MATDMQHGERRARLKMGGMLASDLVWLDELGWSDAAVPPIASDAERQAYARRETALNAAIRELALPDRTLALEGKLAAAIGARIADWNERDDED